MSDTELSLSWGKYRGFLAGFKHRDLEHYELLKRIGLHEYNNRAEDIRSQMTHMFYDLMEERTLSIFYKERLRDLYSSKSSFWVITNSISSTFAKATMSLDVMKKYEEVLKRYNDWNNTMEETRICKECGEEKSIHDYYKYTNRGTVRRHKRCKPCFLKRKKRQRQHQEEMKEGTYNIDPKWLSRGRITHDTGVTFAQCGEY